MRALFTTQPGYGHLNPFLPYAVAIRDAGHEVRFATARAFIPAIERLGFLCEAVGADFTWEDPGASFPAINDAARAGRGFEFALVEITWKAWNPSSARDQLAMFDRWRPDFIVRELAENGATLAGEVAGIPVVCASWGALPGDRGSWEQAFNWDQYLPYYREARQSVGLPPDPTGDSWRRQLTLSPLPPAWTCGREDGTQVVHIRVPLDEGSADQSAEWLEAMGRDRPLVYVTMGTVFNKMRGLRGMLLNAVADLDADVLMSLRWVPHGSWRRCRSALPVSPAGA